MYVKFGDNDLRSAYVSGHTGHAASSICGAKSDVRFTPNSDHESGHRKPPMSGLPPKADICGALVDVRFGPKADIRRDLKWRHLRPILGGTLRQEFCVTGCTGRSRSAIRPRNRRMPRIRKCRVDTRADVLCD